MQALSELVIKLHDVARELEGEAARRVRDLADQLSEVEKNLRITAVLPKSGG